MGLTKKRFERKFEPGRYYDEGGLQLQVRSATSRSWIFRYERDGKERMMGLGSLDDFDLEEARAKARAARQLLDQGIDPLEHRDQAHAERKAAEAEAKASAVTFEEAARQCFAARQGRWKNAKHKAQFISSLEQYAFPTIGAMIVGKITRQHVLRVLQKDDFWNQKTETASRVRSRIETVLSYSTIQGWRVGDNPARWKHNIDHDLPPRSQVRKVRHHPALPWKQMGEFMPDLRQRKAMAARALEFLILSATRTSEVICAKRTEIDWEARVWSVPPDRMKVEDKEDKPHRVPLSDAAMAVLQALPKSRSNPYLFPGPKKGRPLSNMAMLQLLDRMGYKDEKGRPITAHGFRSSFKDWAREHTTFPRDVAEAALAHALDSDVEAAYARGDLLEKRRAMMAAWAKFCGKPFKDNVVTFKAVPVEDAA